MNSSRKHINTPFKHGRICLAKFLVMLQLPLASLVLPTSSSHAMRGNFVANQNNQLRKEFEQLLILGGNEFIEQLKKLSSRMLKTPNETERDRLQGFLDSLGGMKDENEKLSAFLNFLEAEISQKRKLTLGKKKTVLFFKACLNKSLKNYHVAHRQGMRLKAMLNERQDVYYSAAIGLLNDIRSRLKQTIRDSTGPTFRERLLDYATVEFTLGDRKDLNELLTFLEYDIDNLKELKTKYKRDILYWKAECNYRLKNYGFAYQQYLRLRLTMSNDEDPLFSELATKLERTYKAKSREYFSLQLRKVLSTLNIPDTPRKCFICVLAFIAGFGLMAFLCQRWHRDFPSSKSKLLSWRTKILSQGEVIKVKEMNEQDGRVNLGDSEEYRQKYRNLNKKGINMIRRVNNYAPYPWAWIGGITAEKRFLKNLSPFWLFTVFGFAFVFVWGSLSTVYKYIQYQDWDLVRIDFVFYFLIATLIISTLSAIRIMSRKTVESLDNLLTMLEKDESINELGKQLIHLFRSPWQFYISLLLFGLTIALSKNWFSIHTIFVIMLILIFSSLLWLILGSLATTNYLCSIKDLGINPLSPLKTIGLQKWISVIGTYAITKSIVVTFGASISVIMGFVRDDYGMKNFIWLFVFIPILVFYWVYPYRRLKGLVKSQKMQRMHFLKTKISQLFQNWVDNEKKLGQQQFGGDRDEIKNQLRAHLNEINQYYNMFKEIDKSPESYIDISSALELARVMGIPSLFALISYYLSW